jgi:hypothetical protein
MLQPPQYCQIHDDPAILFLFPFVRRPNIDYGFGSNAIAVEFICVYIVTNTTRVHSSLSLFFFHEHQADAFRPLSHTRSPFSSFLSGESHRKQRPATISSEQNVVKRRNQILLPPNGNCRGPHCSPARDSHLSTHFISLRANTRFPKQMWRRCPNQGFPWCSSGRYRRGLLFERGMNGGGEVDVVFDTITREYPSLCWNHSHLEHTDPLHSSHPPPSTIL